MPSHTWGDLLDLALTWCDEKRKKGVQDELSGDGMGISSIIPRLILKGLFAFLLSGLLRFLFTLAFNN